MEDAEVGIAAVPGAVRAALAGDPAVRGVRLIGSRAEGHAHELSDWDFAVETDDFAALASRLPLLVAPLRPLAELWDPYSSYACYMLLLAGPVKVDLIFPDEAREWSGPWRPARDTLEAIDRHFWDWILWLEQKRRGGRADVLETGLEHMYALMLSPLGVESTPGSVEEALAAYLAARERLESRFGITVPRRLEEEIRPVVDPAADA